MVPANFLEMAHQLYLGNFLECTVSQDFPEAHVIGEKGVKIEGVEIDDVSWLHGMLSHFCGDSLDVDAELHGHMTLLYAIANSENLYSTYCKCHCWAKKG